MNLKSPPLRLAASLPISLSAIPFEPKHWRILQVDWRVALVRRSGIDI